jgi:hypothetical protein
MVFATAALSLTVNAVTVKDAPLVIKTTPTFVAPTQVPDPDACTNIAGFQLTVPNGYIETFMGSKVCVIPFCTNWVAGGLKTCPANANCSNMSNCSCNSGYSWNGSGCSNPCAGTIFSL